MRYRYVCQEQRWHGVDVMCRSLRISRGGYYAWLRRRPSRRDQANAVLLSKIRKVHEASRGTYGSPRVHAALKAQGESCSRKRVERLMRKNEITGKQKRRFRVVTTNSKHHHQIAPNLLEQNFQCDILNSVWTADISYVTTLEGWLYLATVMDLCSRQIVGWSMNSTITRELALDALHMAITQRRPKPGLIHHSDRGVQYASDDYQNLLNQHDMQCSMSRKGNCYDNAPMESFFHTLKVENVYHKKYETRREAKQDIFDYIEVFYNRQRIHSSIGNVSPVAFEEQLLKKVA
jgi:putative transposase